MQAINEYLNRFQTLFNYNYGNPPKLNEMTQITLVNDIQDFLNKNYERGEQTEITPDGKFSSKKVIGVKAKGKDGKTEVATNISPMDLFYRLEDEFKSKIDKGEKRTTFLKQNIIDWYNKHDGLQHGNLSKNLTI